MSSISSSGNSLSVGGLASGLDTQSIITGLISIEQQRVTKEQKKQDDYKLKLSTFNDLKTKLTDFYNKATDLNKTTSLDLYKGTTSDSTVADISGEDGATAGNYDVKVMALASTLKVASKSFTDVTSALGFTGSFTISPSAAALKSDPTTADSTIAIAATDTIKDVAAKINRAAGSGATASVIQMGTNDFRLMLTATDEGTKAFSLKPVTGSEAKSIFSDGLDFVSEAVVGTTGKQVVGTNFDLRLKTGGAATSATKLQDLFNGIGSNNAINAGDTIGISGKDASGAAVAGTFTVADPSTDSVQSLMTQIQTSYGGAAAVDVVLDSSGEILVKDKTNGTTAMTLNLTYNDVDSSGSALSLGSGSTRTAFKNVVSDGQKAFYLLNNISVSSQTNQDDSTIAGTKFSLKRVDTADSIKLQLTTDKDAIQKKVQDFLDGYNTVLKFLDDESQMSVKSTADPNNPLAQQQPNQNTVTKGPFAGDSNILSLKSQLQSLVTNTIPELSDMGLSKYSSMASMGITTDRNSGLLMIDQTTFQKAIDTDFEGMKRVFATSGYSTNPAHVFGTYTTDTRTGVYDVDPATGRIDTDKSETGIKYAAGTWSGDGNILNSNSGDSKGLALQADPASGPGKMTFIRGVAGQIQDFYERITAYTDGFVTNTAKNIQSSIDDEQKRIDDLQTQVDGHKQRLTTEFANLELSISKLQSQSSAFTSQIRG